MTVTVYCCVCDQPLTVAGALVFSEPDHAGRVAKLHVCVKCYDWLMKAIRLRRLEILLAKGEGK